MTAGKRRSGIKGFIMKRILLVIMLLVGMSAWADEFQPTLAEKVSVVLKSDIDKYELGVPQQAALLLKHYSNGDVTLRNCVMFADLDTNVNAERIYFKVSKFSCGGKDYSASLVLMDDDNVAGLHYGKNYKTYVPKNVSPTNPTLIQNVGIKAGTGGYLIDFRPQQ